MVWNIDRFPAFSPKLFFFFIFYFYFFIFYFLIYFFIFYFYFFIFIFFNFLCCKICFYLRAREPAFLTAEAQCKEVSAASQKLDRRA